MIHLEAAADSRSYFIRPVHHHPAAPLSAAVVNAVAFLDLCGRVGASAPDAHNQTSRSQVNRWSRMVTRPWTTEMLVCGCGMSPRGGRGYAAGSSPHPLCCLDDTNKHPLQPLRIFQVQVFRKISLLLFHLRFSVTAVVFPHRFSALIKILSFTVQR